MAERKLRYSERKRLTESGTLGDLVHDEVPLTFRNALWYLVHRPDSNALNAMREAATLEAQRHFGWGGEETMTTFIAQAPTDDLLDLIEIIIEKCKTQKYPGEYVPGFGAPTVAVMPDVERQVNDLCERHRFGYRYEDGEARKVGSPALETEVVGPTLLAIARPGWDQVERSFREALDHQRGGETDDALTAAHAALEAALKAVGMNGQFSTMVKQFRSSSLVPAYLRAFPDALDALLTLLDRSNAVRSTDGDAHGKPSGAPPVPQALADLAIHLAGAFILYLAESAER